MIGVSSIVLTSTLKNDKVLTSNPSQFDIEIGTILALKNIEEKNSNWLGAPDN